VLVAGVGCGGELDSTPPVPTTPLFAWASRVDTLPGEYSRVVRAAEFHDSLLVFGDLREQLLWRVNLRTGARDTIGRRGGGPGEFRRIGWVAKVHTDSVAVFEGFASWPLPVVSVATGRGRTVRLLQLNNPETTEGVLYSVSTPYLLAADTLRHVFGSPMMSQAVRDSAAKRFVDPPLDVHRIVRYSLETGRVDTLVEFPRGYVYRKSGNDETGRSVKRVGLGPYAPVNGWSVRADGLLLRADASRYILTLHAPNGDSVRGWHVPFAPIAVDDSTWRVYLTQSIAFSRNLMRGQVRSISDALGRPMAPPPEPVIEEPEQPSTLPALALQDGQAPLHFVGSVAWIPVHVGQNTNEPGWDRVNLDTGERLGRYTLPPNHRLVLATAQGAYVVRVDDDELEHLMLLRPPAP
jgi:hypothetical protein